MAERESTPRLHAIVLAAGLGRRFGGGKLLAPFRGGRVFEGALDAAFAAPVGRITIALGPAVDLLEEVVNLVSDRGRRRDTTFVRIEDPSQGMGASLAAAARQVPDDAAGVFVFLGDMPLIPPSIASALAAALRGPDGIVAPLHDGRRGHPVLFGAAHLPALRALDGDTGAQGLIRQAGARFITLPTDEAGVLFDVDRPEDLAHP